LSGYFTAQLDLQRASEDGGCKRSEKEGECFDAGIELEQGRYDNLEVEICNFCQRPRMVRQPGWLGEAVSIATRLDRLKEAGATFAYPATLSVFEWTALDALQMARQADSEADRKERQEKAETARRQAELEQMVRR
jgi:hypothetical protein